MLTIPERHYSYECKATAQERPYVSRPSRSQQFRNPKLVPKLTNETLNPLEQKKGVADEELAKLEAQRAREREREQRDDGLMESTVKRPDPLPSRHEVEAPIQTTHSVAGEMIVAVAVAATVLAWIVAEALVRKLDTGVPILVAAPLLEILTVATSTGPETLYLLSRGVRQPGIPGNIHRSLGVHIAFVVDVLRVQGRPHREANVMRGQVDTGLGMTVRDCHLVESLMTEDMDKEARVLGTKHENEA
ncbi:hypothetical protein FCIRC_12889 [Fusarium circinatum]|uniref:Uncharacterized protein n=1 Tax=Fusarium circinatum TaxID=48490 RepID=A0A8H5SRD7_FUSCI|nr:hypothetical protein FCIRC_12889 [Fusarium circinatum]